MLVGWDIGDWPAEPTPQQQIEAGRKQIAVDREDDPALDANGQGLITDSPRFQELKQK